MSIATILDDPVIDAEGRTIDMQWCIGVRAEDHYQGPDVRVITNLTARHNDSDSFHGANKRLYIATLGRVEHVYRDGRHRSTLFTIGGPHFVSSVLIHAEPTPRFNAKRFQAFADEALRILRSMSDDQRVQALFDIKAGA